MNLNPNKSSRLVIDFVAEYPPNFNAEQIAKIVSDYISLLRFSIGLPEVSVYPTNTKIVKQTISLASNLNDIKQ